MTAVNTITVGRQIGLLLFKMTKLKKVQAKDIHLIGHSLGAQVCHYASQWFTFLTKNDSNCGARKIGRISGLDPAAPKFQGYPNTHLMKNDADFVDIIHTSMIIDSEFQISDMIHGRFGMSQLVGSIDFLPNGGTSPQPDCSGLMSACSHHKAIEFFAQSLMSFERARDSNEMAFPSNNCDSVVPKRTKMAPACSSMGMQAIKFAGRSRHCLRTDQGWKSFLIKRTCETGQIEMVNISQPRNTR